MSAQGPMAPPPAPSSPPAPRRTPWWKSRAFWTGRVGFGVIGLIVGLAIGAGIGSSTNPQAQRTSSTAEFTPLPSPSQTQDFSFVPPPAEPSPDGEFSNSCDYVLGDFTNFTSHGFRFVAGADITNSGNVGIVVRVTARFKQAGGDPIVLRKTANVPYAATKSVDMTKPVGQDNIDLIQSVQTGGRDICTVDVAIVDTFGEVHE